MTADKDDFSPVPPIPANWRRLKGPELIALAAGIIGRSNLYPADAYRVIEAYVSSRDREPEPPRGNGVQEALGGVQPDWLPRGHDHS